MEPLKNMYTRQVITDLATDLQKAYPAFETQAFVASVMDETWESLELKARMRQITLRLGEYLPSDYPQAIAIIDQAIATQGDWLQSFCLYFPDFVEVFGQSPEHWDISIDALGRYTRHASAEFAVRPFIIAHEERMMAQMLAWSQSACEDQRRLASEGCRPALPWGQALVKYKKDPTPILPILENLKNDPSLFVRKSVANNLNDISKTHPDLVLEIAKRWHGQTAHTDWVVKHGLRTLLKKGNTQALAIFGYAGSDSLSVSDFQLESAQVSIGESLQFSFVLSATADTKARLEYAVDYMKANGKHNRKVFKISEIPLSAGQSKTYTKQHHLADLSTRKHYAGEHRVTLIVNGVEQGTLSFELTAATEPTS